MLYALWEIVIPLVIALLVGVAIGWLIWGWRRTSMSWADFERATAAAAPDEQKPADRARVEPEPVATVVGESQPFGHGSHGPLSDRSMPDGYPIKGNVDSMLYHRPDSRSYQATTAEVWFDTADRAEAAGFRASPTHPT